MRERGLVCVVARKAVVGGNHLLGSRKKIETNKDFLQIRRERENTLRTLIHGGLAGHVRGKEAGEEGTKGGQPV